MLNIEPIKLLLRHTYGAVRQRSRCMDLSEH